MGQAARIGFGALDRGEFKEFDDRDDLERYLNKVAERIIKKSAKLVSMAAGKWRVRLGDQADRICDCAGAPFAGRKRVFQGPAR